MMMMMIDDEGDVTRSPGSLNFRQEKSGQVFIVFSSADSPSIGRERKIHAVDWLKLLSLPFEGKTALPMMTRREVGTR